jgi:GNAT superfamily N-acetyltransferase
MLEELASMGGHPPSTSESDWEEIEESIATSAESDSACFLLATRGRPAHAAVGLAHASIACREAVFEPARSLHIHALYVDPELRRRGIGRALLEAAMDWGRGAGCTAADLNVLAANPARAMYEQLGFRAYQTEMVCDL